MAATGEKDGNFDTVYADKVLARMGIFDLLQCDVLRSKVVLAEKIIVSHPDSSNLSSVHITNRENGGFIEVDNKENIGVVSLGVDEHGNGKVGAYNRKGKGRTLKPGP